MLNKFFKAPKILLVVEEKHVREKIFIKILSLLGEKTKIIFLQPNQKDRFSVAKEFCAKLSKFKKIKPLIIYVCLNTKNTPFDLLDEFNYLIDIYDPMLGLNKKDEEREILIIKNSQGCFCRDTRINYFLKRKKDKNLLKKLHFAPDFPAQKIDGEKEKNKAISVGWLDGIQDEKSPLNRFFSVCRSQGVEPWVIPSRFQREAVKNKKNLLKIFPRTFSEYKKTLSHFSFGLVQPCWDRQGKLLYPEWYLARASSSRIMDYLGNDMTVVIPKYLRFQIWLARKGKNHLIIYDKNLNFNLNMQKNNYSDSFAIFLKYQQEKIINMIRKLLKQLSIL